MKMLSSWNIIYELPLLLNKYNLDEMSDLLSTFLRILLNVLKTINRGGIPTHNTNLGMKWESKMRTIL